MPIRVQQSKSKKKPAKPKSSSDNAKDKQTKIQNRTQTPYTMPVNVHEYKRAYPPDVMTAMYRHYNASSTDSTRWVNPPVLNAARKYNMDPNINYSAQQIAQLQNQLNQIGKYDMPAYEQKQAAVGRFADKGFGVRYCDKKTCSKDRLDVVYVPLMKESECKLRQGSAFYKPLYDYPLLRARYLGCAPPQK